ncbi:MAG: bile acid:sodium symporter family protein [Gammaproteobacteria bacterium]
MPQKIVGLFPLWAFAIAVMAYLYPQYLSVCKPFILPLLAVVMLTMGMTLTWQHFKDALKQPAVIAMTIGIQFVFMPLLAYLISELMQLSPEHMAGMILVGCSAGGTASNVICYLAGANVALSILMTLASTFSAVLLMPALTYLYLNQTLPVPAVNMMASIVEIVLLPVVFGTTANSLFRCEVARIEPILPVFSSFSIALIIAIIISLNHNNLSALSLPVFAAVALHNISGLIAGYCLPRLLRYDTITCRTVSIEVGMQNSGLSVALAIQFFSSAAALPGALFSLWHNISGSVLALYWRKSDAKTTLNIGKSHPDP